MLIGEANVLKWVSFWEIFVKETTDGEQNK